MWSYNLYRRHSGVVQVIEEFKVAKREMQRIEGELKDKRTRLKHLQDVLDTSKTSWLDPLLQLISRINANFSEFFQAMGCAGEVELTRPDKEV